jgi:hypothetical protein
MATVTVRAPAGEAVDGVEVAGIAFKHGHAEVDRSNTVVLAYFRRHGYILDGETPAKGEQVDARDATGETVGTPLRDAAVDPRASDFLPPVNAGLADPHGPLVVSPELHGSQGVRPVLPGPVQSAAAQSPTERADTAEHTEAAMERPARSATKADWKAYALSLGADPTEVGKLNRDALAERYGR